ncbi:MAG: response regulator transcription factor [Meiothermus silvanus]|nr:response regulator transcription factor [Allomeiothermus silvanus]
MPMNPKVRVLLVDDHGVVRQGMKLYLATDSSIEVVGEAKNGQEALTQVEKLEPDVVIMDLLMPVMDGISAIREIKKRFPEVEIVAVTSVLEDKKVVDAVQAGAMGYLLKDTDAAALSEAIHAASRGEVRLHPEAAKRLMREVRTPEMRESLTPRETEILKLLAQGQSNKHIARETGVEERTVKAHVSSILAKLGLSSRTQAALFALKEGLVG